jgi:hypothetical protein
MNVQPCSRLPPGIIFLRRLFLAVVRRRRKAKADPSGSAKALNYLLTTGSRITSQVAELSEQAEVNSIYRSHQPLNGCSANSLMPTSIDAVRKNLDLSDHCCTRVNTA